ncbi:ATP phosphoribosyltransferase [Candidatus Gottesmanbacteria bacterium]|nr:ATP phosphoribosyltransferase [Candidatus Gottesmanbacteria bacterium]
MNKLLNGNLKLAIQKEGRLTQETLEFLWKSSLDFDKVAPRLYSSCRNFPLEILYLRDNDIPKYVEEGSVDIGIIGQNLLYEKRPKVKKLLNLRFGYCSLVVAVPRDSEVRTIKDLKKLPIATSYPNSAQNYFRKNNIDVEIVTISGSTEIAPILGISAAIVDLTSTGSTLFLNDLKVLDKIYDSEAVLIANQKSLTEKNNLSKVESLLARFKGVLSAKNQKYVMLSLPQDGLPKLRKLLPTVKNSSFYGGIVKEDYLWEILAKIKSLGAKNIVVLPVEKLIS